MPHHRMANERLIAALTELNRTKINMQIIQKPALTYFLPAFYEQLEKRVVDLGYDEPIESRLLPPEDDEDVVIEFSSPTFDFSTLTLCIHEWPEKNSCTCVSLDTTTRKIAEIDMQGSLTGEFKNELVNRVAAHFFTNRPIFSYAVGTTGILVQQKLLGDLTSAEVPYTDTFHVDAVDELERKVPKIEYNRRLSVAYRLAMAGNIEQARTELQYVPIIPEGS